MKKIQGTQNQNRIYVAIMIQILSVYPSTFILTSSTLALARQTTPNTMKHYNDEWSPMLRRQWTKDSSARMINGVERGVSGAGKVCTFIKTTTFASGYSMRFWVWTWGYVMCWMRSDLLNGPACFNSTTLLIGLLNLMSLNRYSINKGVVSK